MKEIYDIATIIYDALGVQPSPNLILYKDLFKGLLNVEGVMKKLADQYRVINLASTIYDSDNEQQKYTGMEAEEIAAVEGVNPQNKAYLEHIKETVLSYGLVVESNFEEFYRILQTAITNRQRLTDEELMVARKDRLALLELSKIGQPVVTVDGKTYRYSTMQLEGKAFRLIDFCLKNYPGKEVRLITIRNEDPRCKDITNVNEAIRKSPLFKEGGILRVFVNCSPKSLTVYNKITVSDQLYGRFLQVPENWIEILTQNLE